MTQIKLAATEHANVFTKHNVFGNAATEVDLYPAGFPGGPGPNPGVIMVLERYGPFDPSVGFGEGVVVYLRHRDTTAPTTGTQASVYGGDFESASDSDSTVHYQDISGFYSLAQHSGSGRAERVYGSYGYALVQGGSGGAVATTGAYGIVNVADGLATDIAQGFSADVYSSVGPAIGANIVRVSSPVQALGLVIEPTTGTAPIKRGIWQKGTSDVNVLQGVLSPLTAGDVGVRVQGLVGQSGNLHEWQDYGGVALAMVFAQGMAQFSQHITARSIAGGTGQVRAISDNGTASYSIDNSGNAVFRHDSGAGSTYIDYRNGLHIRNESFAERMSLTSAGVLAVSAGVQTSTFEAPQDGTTSAYFITSTGQTALTIPGGYVGQKVEATSGLLVYPASNGLVPLSVTALAGQSVDLQTWSNSGGVPLAKVTKDGYIYEGANRVYSAGNPPPSSGGDAYLTASQTFTGTQTFIPANNGAVPVKIKGATGQTTDLTEWQNDTGGLLAKVRYDGLIGAPYFTNTGDSGPYLQMASNTVHVVGRGQATGVSLFQIDNLRADSAALAVVGAASQSADLTQWMNSSGAPLAWVTAAGDIFTNASGLVAARFFADQANTKAYWDTAVTNVGWQLVNRSNTGQVPIVVQGAAGQAVNLQEWNVNGGSAVAFVTNGGAGSFLGGVYDNGSRVAIDSAVVHNTGTETIAGAKTFSSAPASANGWNAGRAYLKQDEVFIDPTGTSSDRVRILASGGFNYLQHDAPLVFAALFSNIARVTIGTAGTLNTAGNLSENGARVYSASNPPPYPVSSVNTRTGAVTGLAEDSAVVHLTGTESVGGVKTFTSQLAVSNTSTAAISVVGNNAARASIEVQNTNSGGNASFYFQNNRGSFASYGGLLTGGSADATGNIFGLSRADRTFLISDGASSTGLGVGTITATDLVFGTNNAERMRIASGGAVTVGGKVTVTSTTADQVTVLSGASGTSAAVAIGRTAVESRYAVSAASADYFTDSAAGDLDFRLADTTKTIRIGLGTGASASMIRVTSTGVTVAGTFNAAGAVTQNGSQVALDSGTVHVTGSESIGGIKTFTSIPVVPVLSWPVGSINATGTPGATNVLRGDGSWVAVPMSSLWAAKGTIVAASGASTPAAVSVGTDTRILTADSSQSAGVAWVLPRAVTAPATALTPTNGVVRAGNAVTIPQNATVGTRVRFQVHLTNTATAQTLTCTLKLGTANTNADANVFSQALTVGTAAVGSGVVEVTFHLLSTTTALWSMTALNGNNTATGLFGAVSASFGASAAVAVNTTTGAQSLGMYFSSSSNNVVTVQAVTTEAQTA